MRAQRQPAPTSRRRNTHLAHRLPKQQQHSSDRLVIRQPLVGDNLKPHVRHTIAHPPLDSLVQLNGHTHHSGSRRDSPADSRLAMRVHHTHHTSE